MAPGSGCALRLSAAVAGGAAAGARFRDCFVAIGGTVRDVGLSSGDVLRQASALTGFEVLEEPRILEGVPYCSDRCSLMRTEFDTVYWCHRPGAAAPGPAGAGAHYLSALLKPMKVFRAASFKRRPSDYVGFLTRRLRLTTGNLGGQGAETRVQNTAGPRVVAR